MTTSALSVSLAGAANADDVFNLTLSAFEQYRDVLDPPTGVLTDRVEDVREAIQLRRVGLASVADELVGAVRWEPREGYLYAGRVAVRPGYRHRGVGAALMSFMKQESRSLGLEAVQVGVRSALPDNIAFFEKRGFIVIAIEPHPRNPESTSVTMRKEL